MHDADYEKFPDRHPFVLVKELENMGENKILINAVESHAWRYNPDAPEPKTKMPISAELKKEFGRYKPIEFYSDGVLLQKLYYKDSKLSSELQNVLNDLIESFISENRAKEEISIIHLSNAFKQVISNLNLLQTHEIKKESISSKEKMEEILRKLNKKTYTDISDLYNFKEGKSLQGRQILIQKIFI